MGISEKNKHKIKEIIEMMISGHETASDSYRNFVLFTQNAKRCIKELDELRTVIHTERAMEMTPDLPGLDV